MRLTSSARNGLALCLTKLRNMRGAVEEMRRAVQILPKHVTYRTNLAVCTTTPETSAPRSRRFEAIREA